MKSIKEAVSLKGKKVIVRVDYNVPIINNKIIDDFRIKTSLKTIEYLKKKGAVTILLAHLGEDGSSLKIVAERLKKFVPNLKFVESKINSEETKKIIGNSKASDVILLDNIRKEEGEKKNDISLSKLIASFGNIYVNDAFSVSHREHASVVGVPKYLPGYAGFQMLDEINNLSKAFNPKHPFLFILGGAKFETKIPLVKKFLSKADNVFIGGALANDFFKDHGWNVGKSLVSQNVLAVKPFLKKKNLILPSDVVVSDGSKKTNKDPRDVISSEIILDIGNDSVKKIEELIKKSKFVLWNGPLGKYEDGFAGATEKILKAISKSKATNIIGGGDTVSLINKLKLQNKLGFVSTGGGATLDFLSKGTLPGIKVLK